MSETTPTPAPPASAPAPLPMPTITLLLGFLLVVVGVGAYFISESGSWTALIPAFIGGLFLLLGVVAVSGAVSRKLIMHVAVGLALLLALGAGGRGLGALADSLRGAEDAPSLLAVGSQIITGLLLLGYVVLGVLSFLQARRARKATA